MFNYDVICIGPHAWSKGLGGDIWRRRHHLMTNLAKRHRVLFIETASFSPFRFLRSILPDSVTALPVKKVFTNLWVLELFNPLPFQETTLRKGVGIIKLINDRACLYQVRKALKHLNINMNILLWAYYTPRTAFLLSKLQSDLIVCDVYDKYTEYATVDEWQRKYISNQEKMILKKSDVVFAVSEKLLHYCQRYNENCHLITNGVHELFITEGAQAIEIPNDLISIRPPRIGYVGSIFDKLDYKLLIQVAKKCENYSFVFIGPIRLIDSFKKKQFSVLRSLPNTFWLEAKKIEELPQYYKGLDVCIAPYDRSFEQANWINMLKAWETMASGKVLVSSINRVDNPAVRKLILVADSSDDFIKNIDFVINNDLSKQIDEGIELARLNTWPIRVDKMEKTIEKYWIRKTQVDV